MKTQFLSFLVITSFPHSMKTNQHRSTGKYFNEVFYKPTQIKYAT